MEIENNQEVSPPSLRLQQRAGLVPGMMAANDEIKFSPRTKVWTAVILIGLAVVLLLRLGEVLPPFIWAAVTAFVFNDLLTALTKRTGQPRWVWVTAVFLIFFGVVAVVLFTLVPTTSRQVALFAKDVPAIRQQIDAYLVNNQVVDIVGIKVSSETVSTTLTNLLDAVPATLNRIGPELLRGSFHIAIDYVVYLIATLYLMLLGNKVIFGFINTLPLRYRGEMRSLAIRIDVVLGAYIKGQFILIGIMSSSAFVILTVLNVRYALVLALMVGIFELVPYVGPYAAIAVCSAVAYFQPEHAFNLPPLVVVIIVAVSLFTLRQIEDYVIIPNIIGRIVELPALLVIFTIIAGAALLGPMGLLLGVPIVASLRIVIGYLYYKLVDADREKIRLPEGATFHDLLAVVDGEARRRLLIALGHDPAYILDKANLEQLKQVVAAKQIDLALNCDNEKLCDKLRNEGFSIIELPQEHFLSNTPR